MQKSYCYNCQSRKVGCHANCEVYNVYVKKLDVIKYNKQKEFVFKHRRKVEI